MRKVSEKCKRALSAILAAAMVLTSAPGTTMTAMAAEQTDAIETVVDSEEITVDDTDSPDDAEKDVMNGEEGSPDKGTMDEAGDPIKLSNPVIEMTPGDGKVANRGEASFKIPSLQSNSQVYYVIGDKNVPAADVKDPTAEDEFYRMTAVRVPAPDTDDEATVVVKAICIPNGSYAANYTSSDVVIATFTFAAKDESQGTEVPAAPSITFKVGEGVLAEGSSVPFGTKVSMEIAGTEETAIYYTEDGSDPTEASTQYSNVVTLESAKEEGETVTVKAIAVADGKVSEVTTASLTFKAKEKTVKVSFIGDWNTFSCNLVPGDSDASAHWVKGEGYILANENAQLHLVVSAMDNFNLKSVLLGEEEKQIANNEADFWYTATEDIAITVNTAEKGVLGYTVYDSENNGLWPKESGTCTYEIKPRAEYRIVAHEGTEDVVFEEAKLTDAQNKSYTGTDSSVRLEDDNKTAILSVGTDLAGKTCKVVVKHGEHNSTLIFEVTPILTKVTVEGVKNGTLSQSKNETKSYALSLTPKDNRDEIEVKYDDEQGSVSAIDIIDGKLVITTTEKTGEVKVTLYNKTSLVKLGEENRDKTVLCKFTLKVAPPAWENKALAVKQVGSTDTEIKVSVTAPAGVNFDDNSSRYYYVFDVRDPSTVSGNVQAEPVYYYETAAAGTMTCTLKVIDAEPGKGGAKTFDVKGYFVQMVNTPAAPVGLDGVAAKTKEAAKPTKCSTKAPFYADKITLKKGTTTIYSGQDNVKIATIDYGKNTTYTSTMSVVAEGINIGFIFDVDDDGSIYASVISDVAPGKYTVRVAAAAQSDMMPAEATLPVTIVAGISSIEASASSDKIYLDAKKGGKGSILVKYNQEYAPKTPKVTYTLGKMNEKGDFVADAAPLGKNNNKSYVTLDKKGAITVDKNYKVSEDASANTFAVKVMAADYKGNETSDCVEFTVVTQAQELGKLVVLDKKNKEIEIKDTVQASVLNGAKVTVLAPGAEAGDDGRYADQDIVDPQRYSLSVKGKGITVDGDGYIEVTNPAAKNITITAATRDGGNRKATLAIPKLAYDDVSAKNVRLIWADDQGNIHDMEPDKPNRLTMAEETTPATSGYRFQLGAVYTGEGQNAVVNKFQDVSISVKGGAKIFEDYASKDSVCAKNQMLRLMVTDASKPIQLTLKNGSTTTKYTLVCEIKEDKAPVITLDKKQALVAGKTGKQQLYLTVRGKVVAGTSFGVAPVDSKSGKLLASLRDCQYDKDTNKLILTFENVPEATGSGSLYFGMRTPKKNSEGGETYTYSKLSKPVKITAVGMKKTFAATTKYTMAAKDQSVVDLTYKGTSVKDVFWYGALDANVKGQSNQFTKIFKFNYEGKLEMTNEAKAGTYTGYVYGDVIYEDGEMQSFTTKVTVKVLADDKTAKSYKADNVTLVKGKTTEDEAMKMPVVVNAGKEEAEVALTAATVTDTKGTDISSIKVNNVVDGKVSLDVTEFVDANKQRGIQQEVQLKVVLARADDVATPVAQNKNVITLKFKVVVPKEMLYEEERAELRPTVTFSKDAPENREKGVTFKIEVKDIDSRLIKGVYYTTDGTEPALDAKGKLQGSTRKYANKEVTITAPDKDEAQTVTVKVLVIARNQTTHVDTTGLGDITFAAKPTDGGEAGN